MDTTHPKGLPVRLSQTGLSQLAPEIARPTYDRAGLTPGIVHIGLGNFHRAHQAWYLHRLMQDGGARDWAIIGAGVRAGDSAMRDRLLAQDCLTTLIELDPAGGSVEVIGSMIDFLPVEEGNAPLVACMSDPRIRIVALTITEGGYFLDPVTGAFDTGHPDIQHDIAHPDTPRTAFGAIVAALASRRAAGHAPFTVQSCDNLQGNGHIARAVVTGLARLTDAGLADWIDAHGAFPNAMVDCIVPATGPAEIALAHDHGIEDAAPVTHENFRQWVIEDDFCAGRPDWNRVGAIFSDDVPLYEKMKIRVLNGGHQVLANAGELLSCDTIADCMADPSVRGLFDAVQQREIAPLVAPVPEMSAPDYVTLISGRFANPEIRDTTRRVAFDGSSRHTGFLLPSVRDALAAGRSVEGLALTEALWARMCAGTREDGSKIEPNDPDWANLTVAACAAQTRPAAWLEQAHLYGDLAEDTVFAPAFARWLAMIWQDGTRAAIARYTGLA